MSKNRQEGFFKQNTVEIEIGGKKYPVNKYEADDLKKKLAKNKKSK